MEADFEGDEVEIKTARRSRVLSVEEVIDNYDVVDDNDFRVLSQLDRERISELAKNNPAELVIGILRAHGSQIDRDALKLMLVPSHIAAGDWSSWWTHPIIVQPQVAILATGAVTKKPAVIETPKGDTIGIRHKMFLSHSYDHRVVDGALGGMFVRKVADYLEQFDTNRKI